MRHSDSIHLHSGPDQGNESEKGNGPKQDPPTQPLDPFMGR